MMKNKVIFESNDHFKHIIGLITTASDNSPAMNLYINNAKLHNLIRKSAVEEVEEIVKEFNDGSYSYQTGRDKENDRWFFMAQKYSSKLEEAIKELKAENERLKG